MLKKKLGVLCMACFMFIFSIFTLTSCSIVDTDSEKLNGTDAIRVGETMLTKKDVIDEFNTYYQTNSAYFSYYDHDSIIDSFYTWVVMRQILDDMTKVALYDKDTNPNGYIFYTQKDEDDVWKSVKDYIYSQVNNYEKAIYSLNGYEEDEYPVWLKTSENEEEKGFKPYASPVPEVEDTFNKENAVSKLSSADAKKKLTDVKKYIFEFSVGKDSDDNDIREKISYDGYIENSRNDAYAKYIEWLVSSAKSSGKSTDVTEVLENEIVKIYDSYYDSKISSIFQNYYLVQYLTNFAGQGGGDNVSLSDRAIVKAFLDKYRADQQNNMVESSYISTITSSDGASLVLYNYNGKNFFFTVQHILIQYDNYIKNKITELDGYSSGSNVDLDEVIADKFKEQRKTLVDGYNMLAPVNEDNLKKLPALKAAVDSVAKYYYYDESKNNNSGSGYIVVTKNDDGKYQNTDGSVVVDEAEVKRMVTEDEVMQIYSAAYSSILAKCNEYATKDASQKEQMKKDNKDIAYLFEMVEEIENNYKVESGADPSVVEAVENEVDSLVKNKIASMVFIELEFVFSTDALGNELKNKMGYVMSNYPDENGTWVPEFAEGARDIIKNIANINGASNTNAVAVETNLKQTVVDYADGTITSPNFIKTIISEFGYHIIKVEDIFVPGSSMIDVGTGNINDDIYVKDVVDLLKKTYVCSGSNQTLYSYFYDQLYTGFAGDSSSSTNSSNSSNSGTYFLKKEYEWLHEYYKAGKIEYINKMTYDELIEAIS